MKKAIISIVLIVAVVCSLFTFVGCDDKTEETSYTITFYDGTQAVSTQTIKSIDELTIPTPTKDGFTFVGWYLDSEFANAFVKDGFQFTSTSINLYAKWKANTVYEVSFYNGEELIAKSSGVTTSELIIPPVSKSGHVFMGWYLDPTFTTQFVKATYNLSSNISLYAKFITEAEYEQQQAAQQNKIVKVLNPDTGLNEYYFFTGVNYTFSDMEVTLSQAGQALVTNLSSNGFTANQIGTFAITFKNTANNTELTRVGHIAYYISDISINADYNAAWVSRDADAFLNDSDEDVMLVGAVNFIPALTYFSDSHSEIDYANLELEYSVIDLADNSKVAENKYSVNDKGAFTFDSTLVGKKLAITVSPRFKVNANLTPVTIKAEINDGVNVYTNEELQNAYGNTNVHKINVLRNIKAEFKESSLVYTTAEGRKAPANNYDSSVYFRKAPSASGDTLEVNGNYFTIDGTDLPLIDNRVGGERDFDGTQGGFAVSNVQVGIFTYRSYVEISGTKYFYQDNHVTVNNLKLIGNNIGAADAPLLTQDGTKVVYVTGTKDTAAHYKNLSECLTDGKFDVDKMGDKEYAISRNGASLNGFVARSGDFTLNNVDIDNVDIALFVESYKDDSDNTKPSTKFTANYVTIDNAWANAAYYYGITDVNLNHFHVGQCGGISICVDDFAQASNYITEIKLTDYVDHNYLSGDEPWFIARAARPAALALKASNEDYMATGRTMIYTFGEEPNKEEKFIVPVYIRGTGSADLNHFNDAATELGGSCDHNNVMIKYMYRASADDEFSTTVFNPAQKDEYFANVPAHYAEITAPYLYYANGDREGRTIAYVETHAIA